MVQWWEWSAHKDEDPIWTPNSCKKPNMGVDKPVLWGRGRARDIYGAVRGSRQSQILRTPCWLTVTAGCRHIFLLLQIVAALHGQPWITLFQRFHPHLDPYPFCLCPNYFLFLQSSQSSQQSSCRNPPGVQVSTCDSCCHCGLRGFHLFRRWCHCRPAGESRSVTSFLLTSGGTTCPVHCWTFPVECCLVTPPHPSGLYLNITLVSSSLETPWCGSPPCPPNSPHGTGMRYLCFTTHPVAHTCVCMMIHALPP